MMRIVIMSVAGIMVPAWWRWRHWGEARAIGWLRSSRPAPMLSSCGKIWRSVTFRHSIPEGPGDLIRSGVGGTLQMVKRGNCNCFHRCSWSRMEPLRVDG